MNKLEKNIWSFLPALILLFNQLLIMFIRPAIQNSGCVLLAEIVGWLPNYLASLGFVLMGMLLIIILNELKLNKKYARYYQLYMIGIAIIALLGFVGWELHQKQNSLVYDLNDIYASICGVITAYAIFMLLYFKGKLVSAK